MPFFTETPDVRFLSTLRNPDGERDGTAWRLSNAENPVVRRGRGIGTCRSQTSNINKLHVV